MRKNISPTLAFGSRGGLPIAIHPPTHATAPKLARPCMTRERQRRDIRQPGATPRGNGATYASPGQRPGAPRQGLCLHMKRRAGFPTRRRGLFMPICPVADAHHRPPGVPGMQVLRIPERRALASAEMRSIHTADAPQCRVHFMALARASSACGLAFQLEPLRGAGQDDMPPSGPKPKQASADPWWGCLLSHVWM